MKVLNMFAAVGVAVVMGAGLTGCGVGYTGDGVVVNKQIESKKTKSKPRTTDYELTVDVPNSDVNKTFDVSKSKYDSIQVGQTVKIEKGTVK